MENNEVIEGNKLIAEFIVWRDKLHKETRGGKLMFDVPKHYKWLNESELFTYYKTTNLK